MTWNIVLGNGQLLYADCSAQGLIQMEDYLRYLGYTQLAQMLKSTEVEELETFSTASTIQSFMWKTMNWMKTEGLVNAEQFRNISQEITKETIESLLWLTSGTSRWEENVLLALEFEVCTDTASPKNNLSKLIESHQNRMKVWQRFSPVIQSPYQRPYLVTQQFIEAQLPAGSLPPAIFSKIAQLMRGVSIRQLSRLLKQDELKIAQFLVPYIQHGVICLREPIGSLQQLPLIPPPKQSPIESVSTSTEPDQQKTKTYQIACIDDSPIMLEEIQRFLGQDEQFRVMAIDDPIKAPSLIFRLKPDLILMDITMPNVNGYKLCSLFRNSSALEKVPIIMVTGNKGLIDKARAKMVGATDYLTKPFNQEELLALILKYLT